MLDNTSQGRNLERLEQALTNILYNQPYDTPRMPLAEVLHKTITEKGIEAGLAQYRDLKSRQANVYDFREPELNTLGYQLLQAKKTQRGDRDLQTQRRSISEGLQHLRQSGRSLHG